MDNIRMIEELREKADVTYDEAKVILESLNWNMLDALIALEKEGKLRKKESISYTTKRSDSYEYHAEPECEKNCDTFGDAMSRFLAWCRVMIEKGCSNNLCVSSGSEIKCEVPLIIIAILLIPAWQIIGIVILIAFFKGMSFSITGDSPSLEKVNSVLAKFRFRKNSKDFDVNENK